MGQDVEVEFTARLPAGKKHNTTTRLSALHSRSLCYKHVPVAALASGEFVYFLLLHELWKKLVFTRGTFCTFCLIKLEGGFNVKFITKWNKPFINVYFSTLYCFMPRF